VLSIARKGMYYRIERVTSLSKSLEEALFPSGGQLGDARTHWTWVGVVD
jgi:hypothetical protein